MSPKEAKYTFFSNAHESFSKIDQMVGHKISYNKFKKIKIISSIFSYHNGLETRNQPQDKNSKHVFFPNGFAARTKVLRKPPLNQS